MTLRNIRIAYVLSFLNRSWFWLGIWIFYYLRFTDYTGIGLLEMVMILTVATMEIPSGALADLLGRKKTLTISFLLSCVGNLLMAFAPNFGVLILATLMYSTGTAFYSGAGEALVYDSLKENNEEHRFDKIVSNMKALELFAFTLTAAVGGFLYTIFPGLPFLVTGIAVFFAFVLSFFLKEPVVTNREKFSWRGMVGQTKLGIHELFKSRLVSRKTWSLFAIGVFVVILYQMLNDTLAYEFGFNPAQLGILWAGLSLAAAGASRLIPLVNRRLSLGTSLILIGEILGLSLLVSPVAGMIAGGVTLLIRAAIQSIFEGLASITVNANTESKYRATTLSSYNLLVSLPYVVFALGIGNVMDAISAKQFALWLGVLQLVVVIALLGNRKKLSTPDQHI